MNLYINVPGASSCILILPVAYGMVKTKERFAHCSTLIIPLPWTSPLTVILKDMMLYHPVSLVLLVEEVQGFPIEREIRIINIDRYFPAPGV